MAHRATSGLASCEQGLLDTHDALLLDLDGVLYRGDEPVAHARDAVAAARARGVRIAYVTNNASRAPADVAAALCQLGLPAAVGDVLTSGQSAARLASEQVPPGSHVLVVGSAALVDEVASAGLRPVRRTDECPDGVPAAVVQGLYAQTTWADLAEAAVAVHRGARWIAANRDTTLPSARGLLPGNGSLVHAVMVATGRVPDVAGKPEPHLYQQGRARLNAQRPLVVGDRLDTDIAGAVRAALPSLLVLTGATDLASLLTAAPHERPAFVSLDLRGLTQRHLPVALHGDSATCGAAVATWDASARAVRAHGGSALDRLRAAVVLVWTHVDADGWPDDENRRVEAHLDLT